MRPWGVALAAGLASIIGTSVTCTAQLQPFFERVAGTWTAVSANGEVAARPGYRWVHGVGATILPCPWYECLPVGTYAGISWDGSKIAFTATYYPNVGQVGVLWTADQGTRALRDIVVGVGSIANADSISPDGQYVIGRGSPTGDHDHNVMSRWSLAAGAEYFPSAAFPGGDVLGCSFDARVLVGSCGAVAVRYSRETGVERLGSLPDASTITFALACTPDGSVIIGSGDSSTGLRPWRWTRESGLVAIPLASGATPVALAHGISADGRIVVGKAGGIGAFIWDQAHGMRKLQDVVIEQLGFDPGTLTGARAISADGRTIAGEGFILRLAAPCAGDVDDGTMSGGRDGNVTPEDLTAFLEWMYLGDMRADLDDGSGTGHPDAAITIDDFLYFLNGYAGGC